MSTNVDENVVALSAAEVVERPWQPLEHMHGVEIKDLHDVHGVAAGLLHLEPYGHEIRHLHAHREHHLYVADGTLRVGQHLLGAGSYLHIPAGSTHALTCASSHGCTVFFVHLPG